VHTTSSISVVHRSLVTCVLVESCTVELTSVAGARISIRVVSIQAPLICFVPIEGTVIIAETGVVRSG